MDADAYRPSAGDLMDGRYELSIPLGKGGMAQVWQARDASGGPDVAVKFLRHDSEDLQRLDSQDWEAELAARDGRLQREARLLGTLMHPGIPHLYASGKHRGVPYLAMELVSGVNLRTFLDEHSPLPLPTAIAVAVQVSDALACAHTLPVVHRDLKPANVMIDEEGRGVLIDFGIAKPLRSDATRYTAHGSTLGTRGYQAPEQIRELDPTTRTDVYCFGCILFELLTGQPPFPLGADSGLTDKHLSEEPLPPGLYAAGIPEEIDDLVLRMLAKKPDERPYIDEVLATLAPFAPQPGDAEPRPRTHPDPTAPLRRPQESAHHRHTAPEHPLATPTPPEAEWLDQRTVEQLCTQAEAEIARGEAGEASLQLRGLTERVRKEWGDRRPVVRRALQNAADGFRLTGDFGSASRLYRVIDEAMIQGDGPTDRAERSVTRLRLAECRLAFGEIEAAREVVYWAGRTAAGLPNELARQVEAVRLTVDEQLSAHGPALGGSTVEGRAVHCPG
ncbi:serine/threonine-protein kinase [Streptomyces sp. VRA16 Mangrove soil]|uniref:serine/threonine-protein kinase n=1 Tax=Streptomyces sp. VRA16 Mangrove soil TaxID=2817434 RepID=UPI001A9D1270|nr:serine/threonine-protein kinase [Streptomyces sp. VRA16 Mangrove soil]MBO1330979.1 serine/threonine protein kinase [Streptomyces sp. VRA16 Mangrove soil]